MAIRALALGYVQPRWDERRPIQLLILTALVNSGFHYLSATALAVQVAVLNNFAWCERWTWSDRPAVGASTTLGWFVRFNMTVGAFSAAQNLFFMNVLVGYVGLPLIPANLVGISLCSLLNFFISARLGFSRSLSWRLGRSP